MSKLAAFALIVCSVCLSSTVALSVDKQQFPKRPSDFLAQSNNKLLTAALEQDNRQLQKLETLAASQGGFHSTHQSRDYAIALLAVGRTAEARQQLVFARQEAGADVFASDLVDFANFFILVREHSYAAALDALKAAPCQSGRHARICVHLVAQVAGLTGDLNLSVSAMNDLRKIGETVSFPMGFIPNESRWDSIRVAEYVVLTALDENLWDSYGQAWNRFRVHRNVVSNNQIDDAKEWAEGWNRLENILKYTFEWEDYETALEAVRAYETYALVNQWQMPIELHGYSARAYFGLGQIDDALAEIKSAKDWIWKTYKAPLDRHAALFGFISYFNVAGNERASINLLREVFDGAPALRNSTGPLLAFDAGISLLEAYSRVADLKAFEQLRQTMLPLAEKIERQLPDKWTGRRFQSGWIQLWVAHTILTYDPRSERLNGAANDLNRELQSTRRFADLTEQASRDRAKELLNTPISRSDKKGQIAKAAINFQMQAIPVLGRIYAALGQWDKAVPLLVSAYYLATWEVVCGKPVEQTRTVIELVKAAIAQKDAGETKRWSREAKACIGIFDNRSPEYAWLLAQDAKEFESTGNLYSAEYALSRVVWIHQQLDRPHDRDLARYLHQYARLLSRQGSVRHSLSMIRTSSKIITSMGRQNWTEDEQTTIENQIGLYADLISSDRTGPDREQLLEEAFELSQRWLSNDVGRAVEESARRRQIGDERLTSLIQARDDLVDQDSLESRKLNTTIGTSASGAIIRQREEIAARIREFDARIAAIDAKLAATKADLFQLPIIKTAAVTAALNESEALIYFIVGQEDVLRWTFAKGRINLDRLNVQPSQLFKDIANLRCSLDDLSWSIKEGIATCSGKIKKTDKIDIFEEPFDIDAAHRLFVTLFGKQSVDASADTWIIVPSGPLSSLSFSTLVEEPPPRGEPAPAVYRKVRWLGVTRGLAILPTVASLGNLHPDNAKASSKMYIGFGNPIIPGAKNTDTNSYAIRWTKCSAREIPVCESVLPKKNATRSSLPQFADLDPLPQTVCELCDIAGQFSSNKSEIDDLVYLGSRMTKAEVRRLGNPDPLTGKSSLEQYRVIHFATHGVMAGQGGLSEAALLLSPPSDRAPTSIIDVALTAGEIALLKLDTDWVILSACNTAASRQRGGEAFSGLARAFLYAGARSVLVSHWSVSANAALKITTSALTSLRTGRQVTRPHALRDAIGAVIKEFDAGGSSVHLHPAFWGPFALIGDVRS